MKTIFVAAATKPKSFYFQSEHVVAASTVASQGFDVVAFARERAAKRSPRRALIHSHSRNLMSRGDRRRSPALFI